MRHYMRTLPDIWIEEVKAYVLDVSANKILSYKRYFRSTLKYIRYSSCSSCIATVNYPAY